MRQMLNVRRPGPIPDLAAAPLPFPHSLSAIQTPMAMPAPTPTAYARYRRRPAPRQVPNAPAWTSARLPTTTSSATSVLRRARIVSVW